MTIERQYQATLIYLEQEIDGFLGAAFIDRHTGESLAAHSVQPRFDLSSVSAAACAAITAQVNLFESLGDESYLDDLIVNSSRHIYFYQAISPRIFLYVAADRDETNLALVRTVAKRYSDQYEPGNNVLAGPPAVSASG